MNEVLTQFQPSIEELFDENLNDMTRAMAANYFRSYGKYASSAMITFDDLVNEGELAAVVAYQSFDQTLGVASNAAASFRTHAYPYINAAIRTYCRKFAHVLSISERDTRDHLDLIHDIGVVHIDAHSHKVKEADRFDIPIGSGVEVTHEISKNMFVGLSTLETKLIKGHILEGYSLKILASECGLSKSRVGQIIRRAKSKMKERIQDYV